MLELVVVVVGCASGISYLLNYCAHCKDRVEAQEREIGVRLQRCNWTDFGVWEGGASLVVEFL